LLTFETLQGASRNVPYAPLNFSTSPDSSGSRRFAKMWLREVQPWRAAFPLSSSSRQGSCRLGAPSQPRDTQSTNRARVSRYFRHRVLGYPDSLAPGGKGFQVLGHPCAWDPSYAGTWVSMHAAARASGCPSFLSCGLRASRLVTVGGDHAPRAPRPRQEDGPLGLR